MKNHEEQLIDQHNLLQDMHKETSFYNDVIVYDSANRIVSEFNAWKDGNTLTGKKKLTQEEKKELFDTGVGYMNNLLERFTILLKQQQMLERKAVYWKTMYNEKVFNEEWHEIMKGNYVELLEKERK